MDGKIKIVIIDDEPDLCFLLSTMLKSQGYEVLSAFNLLNGLQLVKSILPNWIIIDNNLPDGFGWEKVDEITQNIPSAKIIKISADADDTADKTQNVFYLPKPIDIKLIAEIINSSK
jgi:two-component system, OmpR family, response regulator